MGRHRRPPSEALILASTALTVIAAVALVAVISFWLFPE